MPATQVHRVDHRRDGVRYTIFVERCEGTMWETWRCQECAIGCSGRKECATIADAVFSAESEIDAHHNAHHQG